VSDAALALAYRHCEQITRRRARNFYYGIRLLPADKRAAVCALYAIARRIDDVGDAPPAPGSSDDPAKRLDELAAVRSSLAVLGHRGTGPGGPRHLFPPGDPVLMALADAVQRFSVPVDALCELVEGCQWDIEGRRYETFEQLVEYCRRVAGAVGRLCVAVYGTANPEAAAPLADSLGVALQLTNILRDIEEDRSMGRVYLPAEDMARFGIGPGLEGDPDDIMALVCFESGRAAQWYEEGLPLLAMLDSRSRACTAAMAGIYRRLLDKLRHRPDLVTSRRVSLSAPEKAAVAARALAGAAL